MASIPPTIAASLPSKSGARRFGPYNRFLGQGGGGKLGYPPDGMGLVRTAPLFLLPVAPFALAALAVLGVLARPARAQTKPDRAPTVTPPEAAAQAQQHFQRARELYQAGSYRDAIGELEAARTLDPRAKDLVYNLALVSEKLGHIDDALHYMQAYTPMGLDAAEKTRADAAIRRLEGARRELDAQRPPPTLPARKPPPANEPHGRIDALTIAAGVVAVGGLAVGTVFGVKATSDRPSSNYVTGRDGSYDAFTQSARNAHNEAILSDIGFAAGLVGTVAAAIFYFGRTRHAAKVTPTSGANVSILPSLCGGGTMVVRGSF